jgi:hypothetical protein
MLQFEQFVAKHGEVVAQAILENLERYEGIRSNTAAPLKQRWENLFLRHPHIETRFAA